MSNPLDGDIFERRFNNLDMHDGTGRSVHERLDAMFEADVVICEVTPGIWEGADERSVARLNKMGFGRVMEGDDIPDRVLDAAGYEGWCLETQFLEE